MAFIDRYLYTGKELSDFFVGCAILAKEIFMTVNVITVDNNNICLTSKWTTVETLDLS